MGSFGFGSKDISEWKSTGIYNGLTGLATKTSLNDYLKTSTFNSKVTEVEKKIKAADIIGKSANTKANTIRSDLTADVATDITAIKMIM